MRAGWGREPTESLALSRRSAILIEEMKGADLLTHLQYLGREFLDERRTGWAFARHQEQEVDTLRLFHVGSDRSAMTLQETVGLVIYVLTQRRPTMDEELQILDDYSSDLTDGGDFVFRRLRSERRS